jgi:hypothetical protein
MQKYINHPLDIKLQNALENLSDVPSDSVWEALEPEVFDLCSQIKTKENNRNQGIFLLFDAVLLLSLLFFVRSSSNNAQNSISLDKNTAPLPSAVFSQLFIDKNLPTKVEIAQVPNGVILEPFQKVSASETSESKNNLHDLENFVKTLHYSNKQINNLSAIHHLNPNLNEKALNEELLAPNNHFLTNFSENKIGNQTAYQIEEQLINAAETVFLPQKPWQINTGSSAFESLNLQDYCFDNSPKKTNTRKVKRAIRIGLSTNFQTFKGTPISTQDYVFEKEVLRPLYQMSFPFEVKLRNNWFLQPEFSLTAKGLRYRVPFFYDDYDHLNLIYAEVPVLLKYKMLIHRHQLSLMAGPSIGTPFFAYGTEQGNRIFEVGLGFELPVDIGLNAGAEFRYKMKKGELLVDLRYQKTLSRVFLYENGQKIHRQSLTFGLGWSKSISTDKPSLIKPFTTTKEAIPANRWGIVTQWLVPKTSETTKGLTCRIGFATESAINQKLSLFAGIQQEKSHYSVDVSKKALDERTKILEKYHFSNIPFFVDSTKEINNEWRQLNFPIGLTYHFGQSNQRTQWFARATVTPVLQRFHSVDYYRNGSTRGGNIDNESYFRLGACGFTTGIDYKISQNLTGQLSFVAEGTPTRTKTDGLRHAFLGLGASIWWGK